MTRSTASRASRPAQVTLGEKERRSATRRERTVSVKRPLRVKTRIPNRTMNGSEYGRPARARRAPTHFAETAPALPKLHPPTSDRGTGVKTAPAAEPQA